MTTKTKARKSKRPARPARDVEAEVTARIVEQLEAGTVPWHQPWRTSGLLPSSVATGRAYRGANLLLLAMASLAGGYASPWWLTYRQAEERDGNVRRGEKGTTIVFWKVLEFGTDERDDAGEEKTRKVPLLRSYTVFNLEQTEGVELTARFALPEPGDALDPIETAEAVWSGYADGPALRETLSDRAFYSPAADEITVPERSQYERIERFYSTLFHEGTHSTGHASRLDRFERNGEPQHFGSERYAREELVAELGAAMLLAIAGVEPDFEQSGAYVANWLQALRGDKTLVIKAAAQAQRAVDRILGTSFESAEPSTEGEGQ